MADPIPSPDPEPYDAHSIQVLRGLDAGVSARLDAPTPREIEQMRHPVGESFIPEWLR